MNLRYDFGEKLDLSKFEKQAAFFISINPQNEFQLYFKDFRLIFNTLLIEGSNAHKSLLLIHELLPNMNYKNIAPLDDSRFSSFKQFEMYKNHPWGAEWESNSAQCSVKQVISISKIVHKINSIKVFI